MMTMSIENSYKDLKSVILLSQSHKQKDQIITINVNEYFKKINVLEKKPKFPVTIRLILPKTIVFNPLQNDHMILDSYDPTEEYILSWKIECLSLPCQKQNIKLEIIF